MGSVPQIDGRRQESDLLSSATSKDINLMETARGVAQALELGISPRIRYAVLDRRAASLG